ncbi:MAG TPA: sulfite exporter TauE/SafE family protein, partial [Phycisphaerae bacterium]
MDLALQHTLLLTAAGVVVGIFGALLGIGGGVFLVPVLVLMVHVPIHEAIGTSLVCVIATSSAVAATNLERGLVNIGLGTTLELATTTGGICGGITANLLAAQQLMIIFAITLVVVAALMGLKQRMVLKNPRTLESDRGLLGGYYLDPASGREVGYRLRRLPVALGTSFVAGNVSGLLGIGGSILTVPSLNLF